MMHHPNMHHQPMSGHPPQHMGHQGLPGHHQMPPHQIHRENRVQLGPGQAGGAMGGHAHAHAHHAHGQPMGGMGLGVGVPPHHTPRPPHPVRNAMHHPQHHGVPPQQMKPVRRAYMGGGYGGGGGVVPPYAPPEPTPAPAPLHLHTGLRPPTSPILSSQSTLPSDFAVTPTTAAANPSGAEASAPEGTAGAGAGGGGGAAAAEGAGDAPRGPANSKEKTPMCLVNELARYNKIKHQYRLTSEAGPAHKKVFTVTLRLGDTEEYTAEGSSIKRAQHAAASAALGGTAFPPPPPRAAPAHPPAPAHHRHAVMPTVELNALAMKLCQPAVYTSVPPVPAGRGRPGPPAPAPYRVPYLPPPYRAMAPPLHTVHRVRVCVGGRAWLGEGPTPQAARHDAAARALHDLRPPPHQPPQKAADSETNGNGDGNVDLLNSDVKSPVSLVHELALKRNMSVQFTVKSERGPPHMRVFVTACTVGEIETEGEGNGKKVSKRRAAERMLEEMRRRWPPALLRAAAAHPPAPALALGPHDRRAHPPAKKKPRNLIKEGGVGGGGTNNTNGSGADNPISRLAVARHAVRARSPQYRVLEERGAARRREFLVQCDAPPHCATGLGPNKKTAKRRAAHNVLLAMEMAKEGESGAALANGDASANGGGGDAGRSSGDNRRKEGEGPGPAATSGGANSEARQPVPGVLLMDYHQQRSGQPTQPNGVSETSAAGGGAGAGGNSPGAKDQLMYLSQLLGFTVQFSDFPKRNHGEYLSLVSLSTEPPVMCHGGGASTAHSHEQCARAALRALALMGLDAPAQPAPPPPPPPQTPATAQPPQMQSMSGGAGGAGGAGAKTAAIGAGAGVAE